MDFCTLRKWLCCNAKSKDLFHYRKDYLYNICIWKGYQIDARFPDLSELRNCSNTWASSEYKVLYTVSGL